MIKIWRPPHVAFSADILLNKLKSMGEKACIVDRIHSSDSCLHIIYNAASVKKLPLNYIVYQTEVAGSKWFSSRYTTTLRNALAIWEYDPQNIKAYAHINSNIAIVTPGVAPEKVSVSRDIPVLFYGYIGKSKIRAELLNSLKNEIDITIIENEHMTNMWGILRRSALVLNIHYYENAPLETFRINEALSFGCDVISQSSGFVPEKYEGIIDFADNAEDILKAIQRIEKNKLSGSFQKELDELRNDSEIEHAMNLPWKLKEAKPRFSLKFFTSTFFKRNSGNMF